MLIGLDILKGEPDKHNGYIIDLMNGIMTGNNEKIVLKERNKVYLQEILLQEITRNNILYQIWLKGRYAKNHITMKIAELTEKINKLRNDELYEAVTPKLLPFSLRNYQKKINQYKKDRNLWEDALLELEQKEIDIKNTQKQQEEIKRFFENKKKQIEEERIRIKE